jgi:hypothetical protein
MHGQQNIKNLMISAPGSADPIEKNEKGGTCSTCEGEERRIQGFGGET